ncbi:MAG: glycosyltransferase family 4 protein [Bacteroidetes bacterium]|nr:glycosyltransferase family 4 protein [Bacteroidota bacterium]
MPSRISICWKQSGERLKNIPATSYYCSVDARRKIAVNARFLLSNKLEGIGYFKHETLRNIVRSHPEIDFYFLFDRPCSPEFIYAANVKPVVLFPPARHPFLWLWWFEVSVALWLRLHKVDLFLSADGFCSLLSRVPTVAVIHDIAFEHYPQYVPWLTRLYCRFFFPRFARHATRIATVSEYSKQDIAQQYHLSPDKIDVVFSAAKDFFAPVSAAVQADTKAEYSAGNDYLLYVGSVNGRKNVKNMLRAFDLFKSRKESSLKFLIAGSMGWSNEEMKEVLQQMKHRSEVIFTGRLSEADLVRVIGSSFAVMYVSLFEGFGVPPLEAMKCEVPCITSTTSSMPEITAGAALLARPDQPDDIADKIQQLYDSPSLRQQLIAKGKIRAAHFSWSSTADLLWASCEKTLASHHQTAS